jgi:hypothetical protein
LFNVKSARFLLYYGENKLPLGEMMCFVLDQRTHLLVFCSASSLKETSEDAKWVAKTHKSNDGQYNGKDKKTNNRPENTKQRTKDCIIRTSLKRK